MGFDVLTLINRPYLPSSSTLQAISVNPRHCDTYENRVVTPDKRISRTREVLLHISGNATNQKLAEP
jgi:hypothetical protein